MSGRKYPPRLGPCGGNPVNVAVYTRRLGGDVSYVGAVGTDGRGAALLDALRGRGVWRTP